LLSAHRQQKVSRKKPQINTSITRAYREIETTNPKSPFRNLVANQMTNVIEGINENILDRIHCQPHLCSLRQRP